MSLLAILDLLTAAALRGGIYALMAVGLSLVYGVMNISNFAHGEFYMIGAVAGYLAHSTLGLGPILSILVGAGAGFVAGLVCERLVYQPLRRMSKEEWPLNAFLASAGLSIVLRNGSQLVTGARFKGIDHYWSGSVRLLPGMIGISVDRLVATGIAVVAIAALWVFLGRTNPGRAIRAVAQDEKGAMLVGINLKSVYALTFALGCLLAGIAGSSLVPVRPAHPGVGIDASLNAWYVMVLSGVGSVGAAIPGGFVLGLVETVGYYVLGGGWNEVFSFLLLVLVLVFRPAGLFGSEERG